MEFGSVTLNTCVDREGFKDMLAKVTLGEAGIILSYEVDRICRNCTDWYPLLDICGFKGTLIADTDGITYIVIRKKPV